MPSYRYQCFTCSGVYFTLHDPAAVHEHMNHNYGPA